MGNDRLTTDGRAGSGTPARRRLRAALAVALAVQLAVGLLVVGGDRPVGPATVDGLAAADGPAEADGVASPLEAVRAPQAAARRRSVEGAADPSPGPQPAPPTAATGAVPGSSGAVDAVSPPAQDSAALAVLDPGPAPAPTTPGMAGTTVPTTMRASAPGSDSEQIFARQYPSHAAARQRDNDASSFHWAVIIGVNDYMGRTSSTVGSVGDAHVLRDTLYAQGWRSDQVLTLTDDRATHDDVVRAIEWLIRSTDDRSTVVFSFSGHMKHESGVTALWPADNRFIWAGDLGRMLGAVRADRMWVSLQGCHAAGLAAPGLDGAGRLITYASRVEDKAYEDPSTGQSVIGHYLFAEGLRDGRGEQSGGNGDGRVSVQEAFAWAAPRATQRTSGQAPYGAQHPVLVDNLGGRPFPIAVTGPPAATPPTADRPAPSRDDTQRRRPLLTIPKVGGVGLLSVR